MFCILSKGVEFLEPLISIIMPLYNCEEFLEESIESIIAQTYKIWELIIVNDASKDDTKEKLSQIEDERIHIINLKKHVGLTEAFAEGYKVAHGDFIIRQDGDDISAPTRLEQQLEYLQNNPNEGMVACLISCFTRDQLLRKDCIFIERVQNQYINYEEIKNSIINGFIPILFPTLMIRKEILDKVNYNSKTLTFDDHIELLLELIKITPIKKINAILYSYRRHKDAYHIVKQKEFEKYVIKLLKEPDIKNHLQYKEFYKDLDLVEDKRLIMNEESEIRVLMLVDALNVGGTETHVLNIVKKMIEMGVYVVIATSGGPMEIILHSYGIKIIKIPIEGDFISNKKKFGMIKLLKNIIEEEKINIVHCHLFASMQLASELYRMYKIPYIVTIHGLFYPNHVLYYSCIEASKIIAVSQPVRKMINTKLGSRIEGKVVVIPNGISVDMLRQSSNTTDVREELSIPRSAKVLCYCSRLDWNKTKAAHVFLFSFSQLLEDFPYLQAIILGDGPGRESIEKEAQIINEMFNRKIVHVVGAKVNVVPYYLTSSLIIGTARVALEGMMCRKPVIAIGNQGYSGPIIEKNKDRQWEMYFGDHDALGSPNASRLTRDIKYLMSSSERRRRVGEWGRAWCEKKFNNEKVVKDIIELYKESIKKI
jgi:glycosyltransferase involved in cell wall biosynthesis